jgi:N-sulfoglucosamine sulfohydrolase
MNWDAVGAFGCPTEGTTPNIDRLAAQGMRFRHAHVTVAVCQPSRSAMMTGRYPQCGGGEGFHHLRVAGIPILPDLLRKAGYAVGILGKKNHSTPYPDFEWDMAFDQPDLGMGRNPESYYTRAMEFFTSAAAEKKPFFLMANSHDPHRPFHGNDPSEWYSQTEPRAQPPSRLFNSDEVGMPGFLADIPDVRLEIAEYYSSVRRCDDTVGRLLGALDETGMTGDTLVIFLSDNGMAFPFAKTNCYLNSTRTPLVVKWPGTVRPGSVDEAHFVSGIDLMPTILDAAAVAQPEGMNGQSFLPVLLGQKQAGRKQVFTQFHQTSARRNFPMRCVQNERFGYLFNPWSDGEREFRNESQAGRSWMAMQAAAMDDPRIAERNRLFSYRVLEEFYDFEHDPNALKNLIDDPAYAGEIDGLREALELWMAEVDDVALNAFVNRGSRRALMDLMTRVDDRLDG